MVLKPDLRRGPPKQGLNGEVIKGRLILTGKDGKGARQKGGHIDTNLIPSPPYQWRLEPRGGGGGGSDLPRPADV